MLCQHVCDGLTCLLMLVYDTKPTGCARAASSAGMLASSPHSLITLAWQLMPAGWQSKQKQAHSLIGWILRKHYKMAWWALA